MFSVIFLFLFFGRIFACCATLYRVTLTLHSRAPRVNGSAAPPIRRYAPFSSLAWGASLQIVQEDSPHRTHSV